MEKCKFLLRRVPTLKNTQCVQFGYSSFKTTRNKILSHYNIILSKIMDENVDFLELLKLGFFKISAKNTVFSVETEK